MNVAPVSFVSFQKKKANRRVPNSNQTPSACNIPDIARPTNRNEIFYNDTIVKSVKAGEEIFKRLDIYAYMPEYPFFHELNKIGRLRNAIFEFPIVFKNIEDLPRDTVRNFGNTDSYALVLPYESLEDTFNRTIYVSAPIKFDDRFKNDDEYLNEYLKKYSDFAIETSANIASEYARVIQSKKNGYYNGIRKYCPNNDDAKIIEDESRKLLNDMCNEYDNGFLETSSIPERIQDLASELSTKVSYKPATIVPAVRQWLESESYKEMAANKVAVEIFCNHFANDEKIDAKARNMEMYKGIYNSLKSKN